MLLIITMCDRSSRIWICIAGEISKVKSYNDPAELKCGHRVLLIHYGNYDATELAGETQLATVMKVDGYVIEFQKAVKFTVGTVDKNTRIVLQRVPMYNKLTFSGGGQFKARPVNIFADVAKDDGYTTYTGVIAFLAKDLLLETNDGGYAVNADAAGYRGGKANAFGAQDAKRLQIGGGQAGQARQQGRGYNIRGGYGAKGCGRGVGGNGGNTGGGWAQGRGGGGGGGGDYAHGAAGGGGL